MSGIYFHPRGLNLLAECDHDLVRLANANTVVRNENRSLRHFEDQPRKLEYMQNNTSLGGKVALVTGAAGALGKAATILLAQRGAAIVAVDIPGTDFTSHSSILPDSAQILTIEANVAEEAAVAAYVASAVAKFGRIDIFFNNAGIQGPVSPLQELSLEAFRKVVDVNVFGVFLGLKYVLPVMYRQGAGSIINTSSIAGLKGIPRLSAYATSKHAVIGLTRTAAAEAAPKGVRVNSVNPGPIDSPMMAAINAGQSSDAKAAHDKTAAAIPARRYGTPAEVAELVAFLASDAASFCNGGVYSVDGGLSAM
ncbi:SDR family NAD(P)-dependent oxidoreductase [Bradyrhizobium sp. PMVTL-01]|uniref:SDR family NAD(P)-dependent oxidoreductase n=1 Tax=Bradyrhizobium sp. PMVTL-01 TaxID=3434999 RepID=UPI003F714BC1